MEETTIPLEALLATTSRAVGVFRSVNTVSKLTVSREKVSTSDGDVDMASFIHPDVIKPISAASVKECIAFSHIKEKRSVTLNILELSQGGHYTVPNPAIFFNHGYHSVVTA